MPTLLDIGKRAGQALGAGLFTAAGQLFVSSASGVATVVDLGAAGTMPASDGSTLAYSQASNRYLMPTGALAESFSRVFPAQTAAVLTSAQLYMTALPFLKGQVVSNLSWLSGSTALSAGSNQWAALFDANRVKRAISADDTSTAWSGSTVKTFAMTTPYTIPTSGLYYAGLMVKATTPPSLQGVNNAAIALGLAPILNGSADGTLTDPASCPSTATTITAAAKVPYVYAT